MLYSIKFIQYCMPNYFNKKQTKRQKQGLLNTFPPTKKRKIFWKHYLISLKEK